MAQRKKRSAKWYRNQIELYQSAYKDWLDTSAKIVKRYKGKDMPKGAKRAQNILYSNVQVMRPALFSQTPTIVAERRHKDSDFVARTASDVIERALNVELERNGLADSFNHAVLDTLLVGRGVVWTAFDAEVVPDQPAEPVVDELGTVVGYTVAGEEVDPSLIVDLGSGPMLPGGTRDELVRVDHVMYSDFAHAVEMKWTEVRRRGWVARREMMTIPEVIERFGARFKDVKTSEPKDRMQTRGSENPEQAKQDHAEIWEIWDAVTKKRVFVAKDDDRILEQEDDPYQLEQFFPCPDPIYSIMPVGDLVPTPDFTQYEGLADNLERAQRRRAGLTRQLRVLGIYNQSAEGVGHLLSGYDDKMVPVQAGQTTGDGLRNQIDFLPLQPIREALAGLINEVQSFKDEIYEVSGVSDILRGSVDPREKASQSKLKAGYASQRLDDRRKGVERAVRDCARLIVEMTVELFPPHLLREISGYDLMPNVVEMDDGSREDLWSRVSQLLTSDETRKYRIDIETGSTVQLDNTYMQEEMGKYLTAVGGYMHSVAPIVQSDPLFGPVAADLLLALSRKYRIGRTAEVEMEEYADSLRERAQQFQQQQEQQQALAEQQAQLAAQGGVPQPQPQPQGFPVQ